MYHDKTGFVTLTYDDDNLPEQPKRMVHMPSLPSLSKRDLQLFFKRLRRNYDGKIRFYAAGEYGENYTIRPHYHFIIFGFNPFDFPVESVKKRDKILWFAVPGNPLYDSWGKGLVNVGFAQPDSINYVAQYVDKKRYGTLQEIEHYTYRQPEFQLQSLGIGRKFVESDPIKLLRRGYVLRKGIKFPLPRYFEKKALESSSIRAMDYLFYKARKYKFASEKSAELAGELTGDYIPYLQMNDEEFANYVKALYERNEGIRRNLVARKKFESKEKDL